MPGTLPPSPLPPGAVTPSAHHQMAVMAASETTARRLWEVGTWKTSIRRQGYLLAVDVTAVAQWQQTLEMPPKQPEKALSR